MAVGGARTPARDGAAAIDPDPAGPRAPALLAAALALTVLTPLFFAWHRPFVDDAYITYRYAANWAAGLGPVYNPGEYVEGYSCFLWMALLALGAKLGVPPVAFGPLLNLGIVALAFYALARLGQELRLGRPMTFAVLGLTALSPGTSFYAAAGMDTPLFSLALLASVLALPRAVRTGRFLAALPALAVLELSRVEGFAYALLFTALALALAWRDGRRDGLARSAPLALAVVAFTVVLFAVRHAVYGLWISTTVISKGYASHLLGAAARGGGLPALKRLYVVLKKGLGYERPLLWMGAWIPWAMAAFGWRRVAPAPLLLAAGAALGCAIGLWSGGDWMPYDRFPSAFLPLVFAGIAWALDPALGAAALSRGARTALRAAAAAVCLAVWSGHFVRPAVARTPSPVERAEVYQREVGTALGEVGAPVTLATNTAGQIAYYAGPTVYVRDLLGLTDRHNALEGPTWYVRFGRADYAYTFAPPLDLFHTNAWVDLEELVRHVDAHPAERDRFRFLVTDDWLRASFLVAGDPTSAAALELERRFGARPLPLERATLDSLHGAFRRSLGAGRGAGAPRDSAGS